MPNVLKLRDRATGRVFENRGLIEVDNDMCAAFGIEPDPVTFYEGWVDNIGFRLACGQSFDDLRADYQDEKFDEAFRIKRLRVIEYLAARFDNDSYVCR